MFTTTVGRRARITRTFGRKGSLVMSATPQPANPQKNARTAADYESFADMAFRDHVVGAGAPPSAADLEPRELLRYAGGHATDDERIAIEDFVNRSRWAQERVVALVRSNRPDGQGLRGALGKKLLGRTNQTAVTIVAQAILEVEGVKSKSVEDAWKSVEKNGSPRTRAACLLGLNRLDDARAALDSSNKDAIANLLRRLSAAAAESDDAALLALLDAFPSL